MNYIIGIRIDGQYHYLEFYYETDRSNIEQLTDAFEWMRYNYPQDVSAYLLRRSSDTLKSKMIASDIGFRSTTYYPFSFRFEFDLTKSNKEIIATFLESEAEFDALDFQGQREMCSRNRKQLIASNKLKLAETKEENQ